MKNLINSILCKPTRTTTLISTASVLILLSACNGQSGGSSNALGGDSSNLVDPDTAGQISGSDSDTVEIINATDFIQGAGDDFWAEQAQNFEPFVRPPDLGAAVDPEDFMNVGNWAETFDWPLIATGATNLPDGRIVAWAATSVDGFGGPKENTHGTIYDPVSGTFTDTPSSKHNMFCSGVSMLPDGNMFVAGGGATVSTTSIFDLDTDQFVEVESMALSRWYPTSTTLASGQVVTTLGTTASAYPEIYTDGKGWSLLPEVNLQSILDQNQVVHSDWYPAFNVAPDGSLFHPGHQPGILSVYLNQEDAVVDHGEREIDEVSRLYNTTVMYDVGKMLVAGGGSGADATNSALDIDLNGPTPVITPIEPMQHVRSMQNTVVLPNGEVLVIGGNTSGIQFSDNGTVLEPEIWNPDTQTWRPVALHEKPRNYHSVALLMKDGRVLSAGGGLCGGCPTNHQDGEIYSPPYLFDALGLPVERPEIAGGAETALAGDTITLTGSDDIVEFNMLRLVALTHHHSTDQRFVPTDSIKTDTGQYQLTLNSNPNVLLPGYYWVFGLNADGTPTEGYTLQVLVSPESEPDTTPDTSPNVAFEYFENNVNIFGLPNFDTLTPVKIGTQSNFSLAQKERNNQYAFRFRGTINVPVSGFYTFSLESDDGSKLLINGATVVDHDGTHSLEESEEGNITLTAGQHDIEVQFFENTGGDALLVSWRGPTFERRPITAFDLGSPLSATNLVNSNPGPSISGEVSYRYFEGNWNVLPNFDNETAIKEGQVEGFDLSPREVDDFYGFEFTALITVPTTGDYTFYTTSDDGSRLSVNGVDVVNNDGLHPPIERSGTIALNAGEHRIKVEFFEKQGGESLQVSWDGPGIQKQNIPVTSLASNGSVPPQQSAATDRSGESSDNDPDAATVFSEPNLVNYKYFEGTWFNLPNFADLTPIAEGVTAGFILDEREQDDNYGMQFTGQLVVPTGGGYTLFTKSDDGSRLYINGDLVVDNNGLHAPIEEQGTINLNAGSHNIVVEFFERIGGDSLEVSWQGPGIAKQPIPLSALATIGENQTPTTGGNTPVAPLADGLVNYEYFEGTWFQLPDFDQLPVVATGLQSNFSLAPRVSFDNYGFRFTTTLTVVDDDDYTFYLTSDDGSRLTLNNTVVVNNDGLHGSREESGTINLAAGNHTIVVEYFERSGLETLSVDWSSTLLAREPLELATLSSTVANNSTTDSSTTGTDDNATDPSTSDADNMNTTPAAAQNAGLFYEYYEGVWVTLPDFDQLTPVSTGNSSAFTLPPSNGTQFYGYRFTGQIEINEDDVYTFFSASNDGSQLFINGELIVDNDGRHGVIERQGDVQLAPGIHDIELTYFQSGGSESLEVSWSSSSFAQQVIEGSVLSAPVDLSSTLSAPEPTNLAMPSSTIANNSTTDSNTTGTGDNATDSSTADTGTTVPSTTDADDMNTTPAAAQNAELFYEYYEGVWVTLPDFDQLTPVSTGNSSSFTLPSSNGAQFYGYRFTGKIEINEDDVYTFFTASNDGSQLFINGELIVDNDGRHSVIERQGDVQLAPGLHDIELTYFQSGGSESLEVSWSSSSFAQQVIDSSVLSAP